MNWVIAATGYICRGISGSVYSNSVNISGNGGVFLSTNGGFNFTNIGITYSSTPILSRPAMLVTGVSGSSNGGAWFHQEPVAVQNISSEIPNQFSLSQNYPNPFNPSTTIRFSIPLLRGVSEGRGVLSSIIIFNSLGQKITELFNQQLSPGTFEVEWNASNQSSGLYFYKLTAGNFTETKKMLMIK